MRAILTQKEEEEEEEEKKRKRQSFFWLIGCTFKGSGTLNDREGRLHGGWVFSFTSMRAFAFFSLPGGFGAFF